MSQLKEIILNLALGINVILFIFLIVRIRKNKSIKRSQDTLDLTLNDVLEQLPGHIYWKNKNGVYLGANHNNWKDFGAKSLNAFLGTTDYKFFTKEQADYIQSVDQQVMKTAKTNIAEEWAINADGSHALYLSHKAPLKNHYGEIVGIIGNSLDITRAKQETTDRLNMLENIIALMPNHLYWLDKNNVYLGCNDIQAKSFGLSSRKNIVGKHNTDLQQFMIAEVIDPINSQVMKTGQSIVLEEPAILSDGTPGTFLSNKVPLKNESGEIIGMVGISVDITERKKLQEKVEAFAANAVQVAHDIRSPLAALTMALKLLTDIPEKHRIILRNAATRINDIANNLLTQYKDQNVVQNEDTLQAWLIAPLIENLVSEKKLQHDKVNIETQISSKAFLAFARFNATEMKRVISNIINNSAEAFKHEKGNIIVSLDVKDTQLILSITDNGCGIPADKLADVFKEGVSSKKQGTGIGLSHAKKSIESWQGNIALTSELNQGTTATITLPMTHVPVWFGDAIHVNPNTTIAILDDDDSVHGAWDERLANSEAKDLPRVHFKLTRELYHFCMANEATDLIVLSDHEILGDSLTGLDVLEKIKLGEKSFLVTSHYENRSILERCEKAHIRLLPKNLISHVPIILNKPVAPTESKKLDLVFIDDNKTLTMVWQMTAEVAGKSIQVFNTLEEFETIVSSLDKSTPIYIDSHLGGGMLGQDYAKKLYEQGFAELYLATGYNAEHFTEPMPWIKAIVGKEPPL